MSARPEKPPLISQQDWHDANIREMTNQDFAKAVPFEQAHPDVYAAWRHGSGRPNDEAPKIPAGFRLASDVVDGIKATGEGYNARFEKVLREALAAGKLDRADDRRQSADPHPKP